jgi:hypothetical protein
MYSKTGRKVCQVPSWSLKNLYNRSEQIKNTNNFHLQHKRTKKDILFIMEKPFNASNFEDLDMNAPQYSVLL